MAKHLSSKKNFTLLKSNLTDLLRLEGFDKLTISDQRNPASGLKQPEGVNLKWTVISKINSFSRSQRLTMLGS